MALSNSIGVFLILTTLLGFGAALIQSFGASVGTDISPILQTPTQQYVTLLPKVPTSGPSPWLIYPTSSTIWVAETSFGPPTSEIREFWINGTSKPVLDLTNVLISSILADPSNPSGRVWFDQNSTLAFYDTSKAAETKAITFPGQSIQYITSDTKGQIWLSTVGSSGAGNIVMYDSVANTTMTYPAGAGGSIVQGFAVAPSGDTIWFAEAGSRKIGRLLLQSSNFTEYSPPPNINLAAPVYVALDSSGNVWFTDHGTDQFGEFVAQSNVWKLFPIGYCPDYCLDGLPNAIFVDSKNIVWFSEHIAGRVARFDPSTGVLTEYQVPGSPFPAMWWAKPGPNNLVWFVAWGSNEIGYVNASIPVPFSISGPSYEVDVRRGSTVSVSVQVGSRTATTLSFGVLPVTQDQPPRSPAQIYGSSPSTLTLNNNSETVSFSISAAWNADLGPRYVALTASDGQVATSAHVRIVVVESLAGPFIALGFSSLIVLGSLTFYLRRPKRVRNQVFKEE